MKLKILNNAGKKNHYKNNYVNLESWHHFLRNSYENNETSSECNYIDSRHPFLDCLITTYKVIRSLKNCKFNTAPGLDCISNDFLKRLPRTGRNI